MVSGGHFYGVECLEDCESRGSLFSWFGQVQVLWQLLAGCSALVRMGRGEAHDVSSLFLGPHTSLSLLASPLSCRRVLLPSPFACFLPWNASVSGVCPLMLHVWALKSLP